MSSSTPSESAALAALDTLLACGTAPTAVGALRTLFFNILCSPEEEKYRKLRPSNPALQSRLLSAPGALPLLLAVGFKEEGEFLVLPPGAVVPPLVLEAVSAASDELASGSAAQAAPAVQGAGGGGGGGGGGKSRLPPASDEFKWCSNCRKCIDGRLPKNTTFRCLACDVDYCSSCYNLRSCEHDFDIIGAAGGGFYGPQGLPPPPPPSSRPPRR
jgi:hypothetical protein